MRANKYALRQKMQLKIIQNLLHIKNIVVTVKYRIEIPEIM